MKQLGKGTKTKPKFNCIEFGDSEQRALVNSIDNLWETGCYKLVGDGVTASDGLPDIDYGADAKMEMLLLVTRSSLSDTPYSKNIVGQTIMISNRRTSATDIYNRSGILNSSVCDWSSWQIIAKGGTDGVASGSEISEQISSLANELACLNDTVADNKSQIAEARTTVSAEIERATAADEALSSDISVLSGSVGFMASASDGSTYYWNMSAGVGGSVPEYPQIIADASISAPASIPVKAGDSFLLTTVGGSGWARAYAFTDCDRIIYELAAASAKPEKALITASHDGYLIVNCMSAGYKSFSLQPVKISDKIVSVNRLDSGVGGLSLLAANADGSTRYWNLTAGSVSISPTIIANASMNCAPCVPVKKGDTFLLSTIGGSSSGRAYAFTDGERTVVELCEKSARLYNIRIAAPCDGYLFVNCTSEGYDGFSLLPCSLSERQLRTDLALLHTAPPCMPNPRVDFQKNELRILDIGNSYTGYCTDLLPLIAESAGCSLDNLLLCRLIRANSTFKIWTDLYQGSDSGSTYSYEKVFGNLSMQVAEGTSDVSDASLFKQILTQEKWDIIIIHQLSTYSTDYDEWLGSGKAGCLNEFIQILRKHRPCAAIGTYLIHSYMSGFSSNTEGSAKERWSNIAAATQKFMSDYGIDIVVPYGTAIQNLRATTLNNAYDLTQDGTHPGHGLAAYTAACCYFQSILAPRFGVSILGNGARYTVSSGEKNVTYPDSSIDVTDENAPIAQMAAFAAVYNMFRLSDVQTPPSYLFPSLTASVDGTVLSLSGSATVDDGTLIIENNATVSGTGLIL